ncbi:MAG: xanthine phosphoribosyltransferase [Solobacterium sp.]|nr:xanthine phosphoribosyltransferase [Solobacterium sp.]
MKLLKERIIRQGTVINDDIIRVDSFLNHQIDTELIGEIGREFYRCFCDLPVTKIVTAETGGIVFALTAAQAFGNIPVVYAKKGEISTITEECYSAAVQSFTRGGSPRLKISAKYLGPQDHVLLIDDFLAAGSAVSAMVSICEQAGATICGAGVVVEKKYMNGRAVLEEKGIPFVSLACIESARNGQIIFAD